MKFDTIIIGGGLAGLMCGIRLAEKGQRCAIISSGQSALHFSSGSFDLLNRMPDGTIVENPLEQVEKLSQQNPQHPYSKIGKAKFASYTTQAVEALASAGVRVEGRADRNIYRVTPMGNRKSTWLTTSGYVNLESPDTLPWKKVAIYNVAGFLDFYPSFISDEFQKMGTQCELHTVNFEELDTLRRNPSEIRSTNIARVIDRHIDKFIGTLKGSGSDCEAVLLPALFGFGNADIVGRISQEIGKPVYLLPTMPPTVSGIRAQQLLHRRFIDLGGVYMLGDQILRGDREGQSVTRVYSENHGNIPFSAQNFVLASGSFFSNGLVSTQDRVYEPVFGLDVDYAPERTAWYSENMFDRQAYHEFGIKTDAQFRGVVAGEALDNVYVIGAGLAGFNPIKEGCGAGVSILTALNVADTILQNK